MKIFDYKSYVVFTSHGEPRFYRFPEEFSLFYNAAQYAFGSVKLLYYGQVTASDAVDHIRWGDEAEMMERFTKIMNGTLSPNHL